MVDVPKISKGDIVHKVVKGGLSAIPFAGGLAAEFFDLVVKPPLSKRLNAWMQDVAEGLKRLEDKIEGFKTEDLNKNEMFISTIMQATQSAVRNHQKEKLEALRNAVLNTALRTRPEEDIQAMFMNYIESLTPWHMRILRLFDDPLRWGKENNFKFPDREFGAPAYVLEDAFPELRGKRAFYELIIQELDAMGLMSMQNALYTTMSGHGTIERRTTEIGRNFIAFITLPS